MIKLTAVSYNNQASLEPLSAVFGRDGGTLGRSEDNYFVLPDPKNLVSRIQAAIKSDGSRHTIANLSQANPILLNGKEIDFNREYAFNAGDEMQIGLYILRAEPHLIAIDGSTSLKHDKFPASIQAPPIDMHVIPPQAGSGVKRNPRPNTPVRPAPNLAELHQIKSDASASRARHADKFTPLAPIAGDKRAAVPSPSDRTPPTASNTDGDALMQAFLKGAGISHINLNSGLTPEFMETLGKLLSVSIQGAFQLLATRASIKREVKADATVVVVRNNNPLKFLSDSETVLTQMLRKKMPGFMGPTEAMQDAFADLQAHQSGMVAGMNGAIKEVLKRFDPKALEDRIKAPTFLDLIVPLQRKARMWDKYDDMFDEIKREAQHDYHKLFGKAFLDAYESETDRIRNEE
jgi:FHA domain-containing protein